MKQLTDEEIVKALECCSSSIPVCEKCCFSKQCNDGENILPTILDLVNRQKAEIERCREENKNYQELLTHEKGLGIALRVMYDKLSKNMKTAKSEAYKEFAEELTNRIEENENIVNRDSWYIGDTIDKLLKEMVGDNE